MKTPPRHPNTQIAISSPRSISSLPGFLVFAIAVLFSVLLAISPALAQNKPVLSQFIDKLPAASLVDGADGYGPIAENLPVAPILKNGDQIGWAFITSDFVGTTGYSGKPIPCDGCC